MDDLNIIAVQKNRGMGLITPRTTAQHRHLRNAMPRAMHNPQGHMSISIIGSMVYMKSNQ
jgi:hypothetical protein